MKVQFGQYMSQNLIGFSNELSNLSLEVKDYFSLLSFGDSVEEIHIGIICTEKEFESMLEKLQTNYNQSKRVVECYVQLDFPTTTSIALPEKMILMRKTVVQFIPSRLRSLGIQDFEIEEFIRNLELSLERLI